MEQHAIPQQISTYEFQLVGSMTLKQFLKLGSGLVIAFIFYGSNIIFFIKWPCILFFGFGGIALAFLPINERPLEVWIMAFIKRITSPSIYLWQKQTSTLDIFDESFDNQDKKKNQPESEEIVDKEPELKEFIASLPNAGQEKPASPAGVPAPTKPNQQPTPPKSKVSLDLPKKKAPKPTAKAQFGDIPMPETPTKPNILVGMTLTNQGKIIENVIIEIQDQEGNPVRALRTNKLGQFQIATPLKNGKYLILPEKENYKFDILEIETKGEVVPPLIIKPKNNPAHGSKQNSN